MVQCLSALEQILSITPKCPAFLLRILACNKALELANLGKPFQPCTVQVLRRRGGVFHVQNKLNTVKVDNWEAFINQMLWIHTPFNRFMLAILARAVRVNMYEITRPHPDTPNTFTLNRIGYYSSNNPNLNLERLDSFNHPHVILPFLADDGCWAQIDHTTLFHPDWINSPSVSMLLIFSIITCANGI